jgi:CRISPR-associated protein Csx10
MKLTFTLTLKADYHIGAGHGLGSQVDSALLRDGDKVPVIRGSTIEGLLRDGL